MKKLMQLISVLLIAAMLAIPAAAASFTPSVEQKGAPELGSLQDANGKKASVIVTDAQGEEILSAPVGSVKVTPLADLNKAAKEVKAVMEEAYGSLSGKKGLETAAPALKDALANTKTDALANTKTDLKVSDLVVRDLVHVSVKNNVEKALVEGGNIRLKFDMGVKPSELLIVMVFVKGEWVVIDGDLVVIDEDGGVTVTFGNDLGPVAFVVPKTE